MATTAPAVTLYRIEWNGYRVIFRRLSVMPWGSVIAHAWDELTLGM